MVNLVSYLVLKDIFFNFAELGIYIVMLNTTYLWLQMNENLMKYNKKSLFAVFLLATLVAGFYEHVHKSSQSKKHSRTFDDTFKILSTTTEVVFKFLPICKVGSIVTFVH